MWRIGTTRWLAPSVSSRRFFRLLCFTLLSARTASRNYYPWLFVPFYLELLSGVMNFSKPNDLGRISLTFGLPLITLSVIFVAVHAFLMVRRSKVQRYDWMTNLAPLGWVILFSSIWIMSNKFLRIVILD